MTLVRSQKDFLEIIAPNVDVYKRQAYTNANKLEMEMYQRFTIPLASFVFALVGAPLGLQKQRSSSSIGFGISILIIFIYYGVMTFAGALGKGGALPTVLAALIPDTLGCLLYTSRCV